MSNSRDTLKWVSRNIRPTGHSQDPVSTFLSLEYLTVEAEGSNYEDVGSRYEADLSKCIRDVLDRGAKRQRLQDSDSGSILQPITDSMHGRLKGKVLLRRRNEKNGPVPPLNEKPSDPRSWVGQPVQQRARKEIKKEAYAGGDRVLTTHEFNSMEASSKVQPSDPSFTAKRHSQIYPQSSVASCMTQQPARYQEVAHSSTAILHPGQYGVTGPPHQTIFGYSTNAALGQNANATERPVDVFSESNPVQLQPVDESKLEQARLHCQQKSSMVKRERDGCKTKISELKAMETLKPAEKTKLNALQRQDNDLFDKIMGLEDIL